jgi:hypothetical protein
MPSTPNLEITHIEQSQAQKEVTANEAFAVLDAALTEGAVSFPSDANYTLSALTTPKEWQYGILKVTSGVSLTATRDLIVPANKKHYIVFNNTTGGQSIRVKTSGGTGITIANGGTAFVRCDGTNVVAITAADPNSGVGYDVGGFLANVMYNNQKMLKHVFTRTVTFPAGLTGSQGKSGTAATAQTDIDIQKNGSSVDTMRFAAAATVPSFIMASPQTFNAGDYIDFVEPATADVTLADISYTLKGTRA